MTNKLEGPFNKALLGRARAKCLIKEEMKIQWARENQYSSKDARVEFKTKFKCRTIL